MLRYSYQLVLLEKYLNSWIPELKGIRSLEEKGAT